jgi:hypothetical protein
MNCKPGGHAEATASRVPASVTIRALQCDNFELRISPLGHLRRFRGVRGWSALPPILVVTADIPDGQLGVPTRDLG